MVPWSRRWDGPPGGGGAQGVLPRGRPSVRTGIDRFCPPPTLLVGNGRTVITLRLRVTVPRVNPQGEKMRKFMLAAAVVAVAACGEKAAEEPMTEAPVEAAAPATTDSMPMADSTTMTTDSTTAAPAEAAPAN